MVPGSLRNLHEGKVTGQMANAANHHSERHGTEDYMNIVHRLGSEVQQYLKLNKTEQVLYPCKQNTHQVCPLVVFEILIKPVMCNTYIIAHMHVA